MTGFFPSTAMPDRDWWGVLWPNPERVLEKPGAPRGKAAIDLCCGDGHFTAPMSRLANPAKVYALDFDAGLIEHARQNVADEGEADLVVFAADDAANLARYVPKPVAFVLLANTFHGVPDKTGLARTVREMLASGGKFAVVNWHPIPREQTQILGQPRGPATEMRLSPKQTRAQVEPAGFELEEVVDLSPYHYGVVFIRHG